MKEADKKIRKRKDKKVRKKKRVHKVKFLTHHWPQEHKLQLIKTILKKNPKKTHNNKFPKLRL